MIELTASQYEGDVMHADYIAIPGACMDTLVHAFRLDCDLLPPTPCPPFVKSRADLEQIWSQYFKELIGQHSSFFPKCINFGDVFVFMQQMNVY